MLIISDVTNQAEGRDPVLKRNAYVNLNQPSNIPGSNPATAINAPEPENTFQTVDLYPNPFEDNINYSYFLSHKSNVSIYIGDILGDKGWEIQSGQLQHSGLHTGELNLSIYNLPPGVYLLKFIIDKRSITQKVVKI